MYYTDDALYPENMRPLVITAAPYAPSWIPGDAADIAVTWDEQVQAAVDCYNAGATVLHVHVRNPATGRLSTDFDQFNYFLGRLKEAVPEMILQVGGSISFAPKGEGQKAAWLDYDTRHMLTELDPKPETVTVAIGTCMMDLTQMWTPDDVKGTHLEDPRRLAAWAGMYTDAGPAFYLEHLKRLIANGIQPYFPLAHVHQLEIVERLIRKGVYMGPLNLAIGTYGGGGCGHNPFDWMEFIRRTPQGAVLSFWAGMRINAVAQPLAIIMGQNVRVGNEDNLWNSKRERITTVGQIESVVRLSEQFGRKVATTDEAREIMKIGVWYDSIEQTLRELGLPPNRAEGEPGFMVWPTDGRNHVAEVMSDSHAMAYCMVPPQEVEAPA
ncbi:3-keto-5-aminohexanoate cleavage protein [Kribbella sp. CA-247076]|uniref:3-keto-5-aminohexanoate cleavage protein n=1 Tax=Kribbella sp. CA-247076 TaxID=3239941 RepID=UPI003D8F5549